MMEKVAETHQQNLEATPTKVLRDLLKKRNLEELRGKVKTACDILGEGEPESIDTMDASQLRLLLNGAQPGQDSLKDRAAEEKKNAIAAKSLEQAKDKLVKMQRFLEIKEEVPEGREQVLAKIEELAPLVAEKKQKQINTTTNKRIK